MRKLVLLIISLTILAAILTGQGSRSFFVDTLNGNDSNPGTPLAPWKTIQKAARTIAPGNIVHVRAGTYDERVVVTRSGGRMADPTTLELSSISDRADVIDLRCEARFQCEWPSTI